MRRVELPRHLRALLAAYFFASLAHFAHNAEYIAVYPNLPGWITRESVWLAWLAITAIGIAGLGLMRVHAAGALLLAAYGALGLAGLLHYTLALCAEHTLATNLTIWSESGFGAGLMLAALALFARRSIDARLPVR